MKSPGHEKWPDHEVREERLNKDVRVEARGEIIADSRDVIRVHEDEHPPRFYVSRSDVDMSKLEATDRSTECPFKGKGRYFNLRVDGETIENAAWTYEDTYEEHQALQDRIAFHDREMEAITVNA